MYWANELARQGNEKELQSIFKEVSIKLSSNEEQIRAEFIDEQGKKVDLGGYYKLDDEKTKNIMCPSKSFNSIIASIVRR